MSLHVVATIPTDPAHADQVRAGLSDLVAATREEDGCLAYAAFESTAAPGTFVTIEEWRDQAALDQHMTSPAITAAFTALDGAIAGDVAIHPLTPLD